ncbi:Metaxin-3 [Smittium mucronatum]|uniref:Metaxin-3 n=1 Tax=Smittium mucronatum TaxID=133383 RepID=A0A1R0H617_9FUNG|nr:Metaxin-3 [Smittium mucronatum]
MNPKPLQTVNFFYFYFFIVEPFLHTFSTNNSDFVTLLLERLPFVIKPDGSAIDEESFIHSILSVDNNSNVSDLQAAEREALSLHIDNSLKIALDLILWSESECFYEFSAPLFTTNIPSPLNHLIAKRRQLAALKSIRCRIGEGPTFNQIYSEALDCLSSLSKYLGDNQYFMGECPGILDAKAFSCFHILQTIPFDNIISSELASPEYSNLFKFSERIWLKIRPAL